MKRPMGEDIVASGVHNAGNVLRQRIAVMRISCERGCFEDEVKKAGSANQLNQGKAHYYRFFVTCQLSKNLSDNNIF